MPDEPETSNGKFALGYKVENPDAPPGERRFVPLNPVLQAKAEKIFWEMRSEFLSHAK